VLPKVATKSEEEKYVADRLACMFPNAHSSFFFCAHSAANKNYLSAWMDTVLSVSGTLLSKHPKIGLCTSGGTLRVSCSFYLLFVFVSYFSCIDIFVVNSLCFSFYRRIVHFSR
jgi:hypothetical protein